MKNTYKIYTLGCKVNQYDSSLLKTLLNYYGYEEVSGDADFAIVNTCTVTKNAVHKDSRMINLAKKENPGAKLLLMGCLLRVENKIERRDEVSSFSRNIDPEKIFEDFSLKKFKNKEKIFSEDFANFDKTRYFIKIQDGCEQFCSYCIIPYTRGKMKSRKVEEIKEEIEKAINRGYREIVLSGIHIGLFGREKNNIEKTSLSELLREIIKIEGEYRLRISSIEITELSDDLIDLISNSDKICNHLHISLQSGSDDVLRGMNRPYNTEYFEKRINKIRELIPDIAISTDLIVGFPGESDELFNETINFVKKISFSKLHVFSFSAHEKTVAFKMKNKVNLEKIKERSQIMRKISDNLEKEFKDKYKNRKIEALIQKEKDDYCTGKSEFYFDIKVNKDDLEGKCVVGNIIETDKFEFV